MTPSTVISALYQVPLGRLPQQVGSGTLVDARTLRFDVGSLPASTGAEVRAQVPAALLPGVTPPPWQAAADQADWLRQSVAPIANFLVLLLSVAILAGGGAGVVLLWYSRVREPDGARARQRWTSRRPICPRHWQARWSTALPTCGCRGDSVRPGAAGRGEPQTRGRRRTRRVCTARPQSSLQRYERVLLVALFGRGRERGRGAAVADAHPFRQRGADPGAASVLKPSLPRACLWPIRWSIDAASPARLDRLSASARYWPCARAAGPGGFVPAAAVPGVLIVSSSVGGGVAVAQSAAPHRRGALEAERWRAFRTHLQQETHTLDDAHLAYAVALGADRDYLRQLEPPPSGRRRSTPARLGPARSSSFRAAGMAVAGTVTAVARAAACRCPAAGLPARGPQGWSDALADLLQCGRGRAVAAAAAVGRGAAAAGAAAVVAAAAAEVSTDGA